MAEALYSRRAMRDIERIGLHIGEDSPGAALRLLERIEETCNLLADQPELGERRPEYAPREYRSFSIGNYVTYYTIIPDGIIVARVLHGARDHTRLL